MRLVLLVVLSALATQHDQITAFDLHQLRIVVPCHFLQLMGLLRENVDFFESVLVEEVQTVSEISVALPGLFLGLNLGVLGLVLVKALSNL